MAREFLQKGRKLNGECQARAISLTAVELGDES